MIGVIVNAVAIIVGGLVGLLLKKGIPERVSSAVITALGLCIMYIGIDGALEGSNTIVLIVSMVLGTVVGSFLNIDGALNRFGDAVERKFNNSGSESSISEGFITASLMFAVGAMAIIGSIESGLSGDNSTLYTKSLLDMVTACMLASTLGAGVLLSAATIFVYQGVIVLLAGLLQSVLTDAALLAEITCAGSIMIFAIGINMVFKTKIKIADQLPAILFVPLIYALIKYLPAF